MSLRYPMVVLGVLLCAGAAHAQVRPARWAAMPTPESVEKFYPNRAIAARQTGSAILDCRVGLDGVPTGCVVEREQPEGYGFGEAALKLSSSLRFTPQTVDGVPVDGGPVRIPINFAIPKTVLDIMFHKLNKLMGAE